jgi:hypothetical protein
MGSIDVGDLILAYTCITVKDNRHLVISTGLYDQRFFVLDGNTYTNINMLQHNGTGKVRFPVVLHDTILLQETRFDARSLHCLGRLLIVVTRLKISQM